MATDGLQLLNQVGISTPHGYALLRLLAGDIRETDAEVLAVSTHANVSRTVHGDVLAALGFPHGIPEQHLEPLFAPHRGRRFGTYRVADERTQRPLLVVALPAAHRATPEQPALVIYRDAVSTLFASLAALEVRGTRYRSLAMTVLGGNRGYAPQQAIRILVEESLAWLERSRSMERLDLVLYADEHRDAWSAAFDGVVRPAAPAGGDALLQALATEICARLVASRRHDSPMREQIVQPIRRALSRTDGNLALQWLTVPARLFAERVVAELTGDMPPGTPLHARIEALHGRIETWMVYHLHVLRVYGNEGAHYRDTTRLETADVTALLTSFLRVLLWWNDHGAP
ncbi:MAG: hypothetical protein D6776_05130 [Planctomycetota bacterium]|nr:MAG: hypothetical protein D6776_05130 [Planctomycetota bacterium]